MINIIIAISISIIIAIYNLLKFPFNFIIVEYKLSLVDFLLPSEKREEFRNKLKLKLSDSTGIFKKYKIKRDYIIDELELFYKNFDSYIDKKSTSELLWSCFFSAFFVINSLLLDLLFVYFYYNVYKVGVKLYGI